MQNKICTKYAKQNAIYATKYATNMQYIYIYYFKKIIFGGICIICKTNRPNQQYSSWRIKSQYAEYALPALLMVE